MSVPHLERVEPVVAVASEADATAMVEVVHAAFGARPALDPPSTAGDETAESIAEALRQGGGIYAAVDDRPAGVILVGETGTGVATFARVSVHPDFQRHGIASAMVAAAEDLAAVQGHRRVELFAREELAELIAFWAHRGFAVVRTAPHGVVLAKDLPRAVTLADADATRDLGRRLAGLVGAGDLLVLSGELGAGKTTLTQGLGEGLGVTGSVISPTFVLSRVHASATGRPTLVHVDAYRLAGPAELDDLDLEASAPTSVTVVEWGRGLVEQVWDERLEIDLLHDPDGGRVALLRPFGDRWSEVDLRGLGPSLAPFEEAAGA